MRGNIKAFKALSAETNLRILNILLERECCVCEVMQALEISQSRASRHLSALYDAGFLKLKKEGLWSLYSIDEEMEDYLSDLVSAARKSLAHNQAAIHDKELLKKAERIGTKCLMSSNKTKTAIS
jgi:ArsR family transcriptional regulator, arsenate/arsenite/antimonite-responsive transcriptional repressor